MSYPVTPDERVSTRHEGNGHGGDGQPPIRKTPVSWTLRIVALLVVAIVAAWAYYANVYAAKPAMDMSMRAGSGSAAFPVVTAAAERGAVSGVVTYTGTVAPFNEQEIFPRVTGRIIEMSVYPGDAVRAGQVVARLDDVELTSRLREAAMMAATAQANRAQMEADLLAASHGIAQMEREVSMVEAELAYASSVRARSERLVERGIISRQEYENDRSMAQSLEAKREAARAKLEQARAMEVAARRKLDAAESMVSQGQAAEQTARIVRDYVSITAPASGYVVKRLVAPGVLVQPGTPIVKIAEIDRVRLQANVGEKDIGAVRVGSPVTVTTTAGQTLTARVTSVFPFVDQGPRTAVVEAIVANRDRSLLPGQYVTMKLVTGQRTDAITVPRGALARLGGTAKIWVVRDGRAEPQEVTAGLEGVDRVEIVRGLTGTDQVVVIGHESLYAGARVSEGPAGAGPTDHSGHDAASGGTPANTKQPAAPASPSDPTPKEGGHAGH